MFTRRIDLHAGLNIVWAKESASNDASGLASAGHGVGKTSLCLLLRYVLGDDAPAIATLRRKAAGSFPKGGVAAKVYVDGAAWLVFRPYGLYSHPMAAQCEALELLLLGTAGNDFAGYSNALEQFSIGRLAARSLPGTNQPLEWRHLLAWCIREQRTRFDGFYHWRDGEGLGFTRPRRDPPLLVGSVLGLVDLELDQLLREIDAKQKEVEQGKERIPELERAPAYALAHADRELRLRVRAEEDEPVFMTTVGESRMEQDLAELRELKTADQFMGRLTSVEAATLTDDYWTMTLPMDLATSAGRSPALFGFYAAQTLLGANALFSNRPVADLLDPPAQGQKKALERHHIFPKQHLKKQGIESVRDINQIANYGLLEWDDNIAISDAPPSVYWPEYAKRFSQAELTQMCAWHALPGNWWELTYTEFLAQRRPLIAQVIKTGYLRLVGQVT